MFQNRDVLWASLADESDYSSTFMRFMTYNTRISIISVKGFPVVIHRSSDKNASLHVGSIIIKLSSDDNNISQCYIYHCIFVCFPLGVTHVEDRAVS